MKVAVIANSAWYLYNFRRNLMRSLMAAGHEVVAVSAPDDYAERLRAEGFRYQPLRLSASGTNPFREAASLWQLGRTLAREGVQVALTYTPKINIYAGLAGTLLRFVHIPNVSGLGRVFIAPSALTFLVRGLYRLAFRRAAAVVFQNEDDRRIFVDGGFVARKKTVRVPGSGVDLRRFEPAPESASAHGSLVFLLVARLLWDKGVGEFVAAARTLRVEHPSARFELLGSCTADNPAAIAAGTLQEWLNEGIVQHTDHVDDVRPHLARAACVVLPSYREGLPRSLLEAAAMAKPLIATDVPGCRDTVDDGRNGFLCRPRDADSLLDAMRRFVALSPAQRQAMGHAGRAKVEQEFDERRVLETYLSLLAPANQ